MPKIPIYFELDRERDHDGLSIGTRGKVTVVEWTGFDISVRHSGTPGWPDLDDVLQHTPNLKAHGRSGFTIGKYGEFFLGDLPAPD